MTPRPHTVIARNAVTKQPRNVRVHSNGNNMANNKPNPNTRIVKQLVSYLTAAPHRALPARVHERAKHHLLDTLAAMISGSRLLPGKRAIEFARDQGGNAEACVIGSDIL